MQFSRVVVHEVFREIDAKWRGKCIRHSSFSGPVNLDFVLHIIVIMNVFRDRQQHIEHYDTNTTSEQDALNGFSC